MPEISNQQLHNFTTIAKRYGQVSEQNSQLKHQNYRLAHAYNKERKNNVMSLPLFTFAAVGGAVSNNIGAFLSKLSGKKSPVKVLKQMANTLPRTGKNILDTSIKGAGRWILGFAIFGAAFSAAAKILSKD